MKQLSQSSHPADLEAALPHLMRILRDYKQAPVEEWMAEGLRACTAMLGGVRWLSVVHVVGTLHHCAQFGKHGFLFGQFVQVLLGYMYPHVVQAEHLTLRIPRS